VSVLSLAARKQLAEVGTGFQDQNALGLVRGGAQAYITTFDLNAVKVLSTQSLQVTQTIKVGAGAADVVAARTPAGEDAYVTRPQSGGSVGAAGVVRNSSGKLIKTIELAAGAQTATATPDNTAVWVGSAVSGNVWVISTRTLKVVDRVRAGTEPTGLAIDYQRQTAYVTNYKDDTVSYFKLPR
jgi:YVTN family beta-propeller protein